MYLGEETWDCDYSIPVCQIWNDHRHDFQDLQRNLCSKNCLCEYYNTKGLDTPHPFISEVT